MALHLLWQVGDAEARRRRRRARQVPLQPLRRPAHVRRLLGGRHRRSEVAFARRALYLAAMLSVSEAEGRAGALVEAALQGRRRCRRRPLYRRCRDRGAGAARRAGGRDPLRGRGDRPALLRRQPLGERLLVRPLRRGARALWSSARRRWRARRRRIPMPASRPRSGCCAAAAPDVDGRRRRRSVAGRAQGAGAGDRGGGARRPRHHQFGRRRGQRRADGGRARHQPRLLPRLYDQRLWRRRRA